MSQINYPVTDSVEALSTRIQEVREAQRRFATYPQDAVDRIFRAAATAANHARLTLAKMAVEETKMGVVEDKVIKNNYAAEYTYNAYKDSKTCGVIDEDSAYGIRKIAEPLGIIAAIIPTTNPTSTTIFKILIALKTRNAVIVSPHPRAKACTVETARIMLEAAVQAGAPEGLIAWIDVPSLEMTHELMSAADTILATGGPGMVRSAYSSGKPALGVGPGNTPVVIDSSADILLAVNSIIHSKTFDNGMICASEQAVIVVDAIYDAVRDEFTRRACHLLRDDQIDQVRQTVIINGSVNAKVVGQTATTIAELAGIEVPPRTKILIGEVDSVEMNEAFAHEKLSPVLALYRASDYEDALNKAERLLIDGGHGHTASVYLNTQTADDRLQQFAERMQACRILVNTPSSQGGIGDIYNFKLQPSLTLGCGSWGGNSVSENVGIKHLLNIKTVAERRENMLWYRVPERVYLKPGCLPVALDELGTRMKKQRAFIVTDQFLYDHGFTRSIEQTLESLGMAVKIFTAVEPDPTLSSARAGAAEMQSFRPDVILAVGGGSPMDAAKIMWVLYEHPEADFHDMALRFMDIRKRVYTFPELGAKASFVAIPTTAGTGSEVTPFAVITDDATGIKYPLADYELLPNMAIIDSSLMLSCPPSLTAASGIDAVAHALEAYAGMMATDYTDASALQSLKLSFQYLPRAYASAVSGEPDPHAREQMANAATLAGLAFANAFLGVMHSMAHKLGAFHDIPHGIANALLMNEVLRFNASEAPTKMGTFPQYDHPHTLRRYAEIAEALQIPGANDHEKFAGLLAALDELKRTIGIKPSIREYQPDEAAFLASLDEMAELAFDDQCTGNNPRYPLIAEIRQMYLNAYYGTTEGDHHEH